MDGALWYSRDNRYTSILATLKILERLFMNVKKMGEKER